MSHFLRSIAALIAAVTISSLAYAQIGPEQIISDPVFIDTRLVHKVDLDGDGLEDVVASQYGWGSSSSRAEIAWWRNTGNGLFTGLDTISQDTLYYVEEVHSGDLDGDNDQDLIIIYNDQYYCGWSGGKPDWTKSANRAPIPPPPPPVYEGMVVWIENLGNGEFAEFETIDTVDSRAQSVFAEDLDGDNDIDILLGTWYNTGCNDSLGMAVWYENLGDATFAPYQFIAPISDSLSVFTIRAADLDDDQDMDVIASQNKHDEIVWYENLGGGTFGPQNAIDTSIAYGVYFELGDLDGDDDPDLLVGEYDEVLWVENDGGSLVGPAISITTEVENVKSVHYSDLDNDGDNDAMSGSQFDETFAWYENLGGGVFGPKNDLDTLGGSVARILPIEATSDSFPEVLAFSFTAGEIAWYENFENDSFSIEHIITPEVASPKDINTVDIDGDLDNDLVVGSISNDMVLVYLNDGTGQFSDPQVATRLLDGPSRVVAKDMDNDQDIDLVIVGQYDDEIAFQENLGNGLFALPVVFTDSADNPTEIKVEDLDGDDLVDVIAAHEDDHEIAWYKNLGGGSFAAEVLLTDSAFSNDEVFVADLDGDQDLDVLAASHQSQSLKVIWFENDGAGNFAPEQVVHTGIYAPYELTAFDLDYDNDLDVIFGGSSTVYWSENLGGGNFSPAIELWSGFRAYIIKPWDIIDNAGPELFTSTNQLPTFRMYENVGPTLYDSLHVIDQYGVNGISFGDLDGDLDPDIAVTRSHRVSWYENLYELVELEEDDESPFNISVYPNPTTGPCIVRADRPSTLNVYDAFGRHVLTKQCNQLAQVHLEDEPDGVYFLQFETGIGVFNYRVVKMN